MPPEVECHCIRCRPPSRTRRRGATLPSSVSLLPCIPMSAQHLALLPIAAIDLIYTRFLSAGRRYTHSSSFGVDYHYDTKWPYSAGFREHPMSTISSIYWVSAGCRYQRMWVLRRTLIFYDPRYSLYIYITFSMLHWISTARRYQALRLCSPVPQLTTSCILRLAT